MSAHYPRILGYDLREQIGAGGFSRVFRAENRKQHHVAACKVMLLAHDVSKDHTSQITKEIRIHKTMKHENVLEFLDAAVVNPGNSGRYVPAYYMLLEFAGGGDLFDKIAPDVGLADEVARHYFQELVAGLEYIHSEGVCHRDLKPENLLLSSIGTLKITDFGLAAVFMLRSNGDIRRRQLHKNCGTLPYVAPEVNYEPESQMPYSAEPVDVWGAGVVLYTLLAGNTPWNEPSRRSPEFRGYLSGDILKERPWSEFDRDARELICALLTVRPEERLTLEDTRKHPWFRRTTTVGHRGPENLLNALTQSLRDNGDLDVATPPNSSPSQGADEEAVPDSQPRFTESLTIPDGRYLQYLTRFYASLPPDMLLPHVQLGLTELAFACQEDQLSADLRSLSIYGRDERHERLRGWVEMVPFKDGNVSGTLCVMKRTEGNPISWRRLWRSLVQTACVQPHVLRKPVAQ